MLKDVDVEFPKASSRVVLQCLLSSSRFLLLRISCALALLSQSRLFLSYYAVTHVLASSFVRESAAVCIRVE